MSKFFFSKILTIFLLINIIHSQSKIYPDTYKEKDFIFPDNDKTNVSQYNLVDAKVLTKEKITLYIKKQGINLEVDDCCDGYITFNAWTNTDVKTESDLQEILSNAKYTSSSNILSYKFPVPRIETPYYEVYHKLWIFDHSGSNSECIIYFNNDNPNDSPLKFNLNGKKEFLELKIAFDSGKNKITCDKASGSLILDENYSISKINFRFSTQSYSPAVAMHWTYYKINMEETDPDKKPNFSIKGIGICSYTNPCVKGYACSRGKCEKCHPSCFDCLNGGLSTDCLSQCSSISTSMLPNRGSCPLGYVDLTQFEDFTTYDIIPPFRNRRLTTSYWFFISSLPDKEAKSNISVSFDPKYYFEFHFQIDFFQIYFHGLLSDEFNSLNTWYFVKGGISNEHGGPFLFVKYFADGEFKCYNSTALTIDGYGNGYDTISFEYHETIDYESISFTSFYNLTNKVTEFKFYIKQLVLFREYLLEPYNNKYFSYEKIFTSTFELPEVLFVIPFDELIKNGDKYDVKCYSYAGSIIENSFTLTPRYDASTYSLYPPKLFRRLNLLGRNEKFITPDLVNKSEVIRDANTLIAAYDYLPLSCIDHFFLTYIDDVNPLDETTYKGSCNADCDEQHSMIPYLSTNKGFCNKKCGDNSQSQPVCLHNNIDLLNIKSNFRCKTGYYESYDNCEKYETEKDLVFYFDSYQYPANIVIDVIEYNLKSYIIDFWMKPELSIDRGRNLFYTNQFRIYYDDVCDDGNDVESCINFYSFENRRKTKFSDFDKGWGHYSIEVYYDPRQPYNQKSKIYLQKNYLEIEYNEDSECAEYTENPIPLEYIYFCNGRRSSCNNLDMGWDAAYYKNLRLFNGNLAQRFILHRYDEYYSEYKFLLSSIKFYYPLYGHYIANNLWSQFKSQDSALNLNSPTNDWNYPQYGYNRVPFKSCTADCNNCDQRFELKKECYSCINDYHLFKDEPNKEIKCNKDYDNDANETNYVLCLPTNSNFDMTPLKGLKHPDVTVTFFIKIYGFAVGGNPDVIFLGEKLKISYNSDPDSEYFGLNLITYKGDNEIIVSNYYHFRRYFGIWTFISVSVYDQSNESFFPPMVRFEINDKVIPIIGPLENLSIGTISFSEHLFALVRDFNVYGTYLIGTNTFEMNKDEREYRVKKIDNDKIYSYFTPVKSKEECKFANFDITATNKENSDIIVPDYNCVIDELKEVYSDMIVGGKDYYSFDTDYYPYPTKKTSSESCAASDSNKCSCNFKNEEMIIFLGDMSNHYCKNLSFINFAKAEDIIIKNVNGPGRAFTLHFWVFAYSYIDKVFQGISVDWKNFVTIKVGLDSTGNYYFTCLIKDKETKKYVDFKMNEWNFLHCSVDYSYSKFYIASDERSYAHSFTYSDEPNYYQATDLIIKDLNTVSDWGILFYKHIRIWDLALKYSSFLSRIKIEYKYFSNRDGLFNQWQTEINIDHKMIANKNGGTYNYNVKYSSKIGTNIVNEKIYTDNVDLPKLCDETGQYYDRKNERCINFIDVSDLTEDLEIKKIDVSYSHNYGMAFWILFEDHHNVVNSLDFEWKYHMKISLQHDSTFKAYCFPQYYEPYSEILDDKSIPLNEKGARGVLNVAMNEYTDDFSGVWIWFQCFLSYNNRKYYLNENEQTLITETLYREGNTEFKNDEPLGRFFNDIDDNLSSVKLGVTSNKGKKVYMRSFYLFKDYLPYNYNFKYMDMSQINGGEFPPLTLAINFASFKFSDRILNFKKYASFDNKIINNDINDWQKKLEFSTSEFQLASNFVFLPLCEPTLNEKFNTETFLCEEITICDVTELNARYCMDEATPLICKNNYYINIDSDGVTCQNYCKNNKYFRSPGSYHATGICGTECLSETILKTCPNSASSILTYESDFQCNPGYYRLGYQCISEPNNAAPNKGALFYSGVNFPYNIVGDLKSTQTETNYIIEFWLMIDHTIYTKFNPGVEYYYFYAYPHQIFLTNNSSTIEYTYRFNKTPIDSLTKPIPYNLIHQYEWNKFLIIADRDKEEYKKTITIIINFDRFNPVVIDIGANTFELDYLLFCTNSRVSGNTKLKYPDCKSIDIKWASAYYNNIRIWNSEISTVDTIQSFVNGIYSEYPTSLLIFYPLTVQYLDNNQLTNIMGDEKQIISKTKTATNSALYNKDNIIIYNYSTKFDWGILHKKQFVFEMSPDKHEIDPNDARTNCDNHCIRCFSTDNIKDCYECEEGYVLQYKECKDARKLYFLKTPSGKSGASISFKTKNKDQKDFLDLTSFTIVFWMKFFGIKHSITTENCRILSIDANTYLAYNQNEKTLDMYENSLLMFRDRKFKNYFGVWIPICIANYISNANNYVYPNMFTLSVNKIDIPFQVSPVKYVIPDTGIKITELSFGSEIISLFAELSIYSKFIQGAYGRIRSLQYLTDQFFYKSLTGTKPNDCLVPTDDLTNSDISLICAPDYSVNFIDNYYCKDDLKYFDPYNETNFERPDGEKCGNCTEECITLCFSDNDQSCTCDMTEGIYWLRKHSKSEDRTYCEHIYYLDFSNIIEYKYVNTPITKTQEYTIEFWVFVYSYTTKENFKELYLEWNYHNKITLFHEDNSLKVNCQPIWRSHDFSTSIYSDVRTNSMSFRTWEYVRCGTDLKNRKYFSNTNIEYDLKAKKDTFFDFDTIDSESTPSTLKYFRIYKSEDFLVNFGFIFIKEIKLWQQYNLDFLDSKYVYFDMTQITREQIKKDFPGLLLYYQNDFNLTSGGNSVIKEILSDDVQYLPRATGYVGYNILNDLEGEPSKFQKKVSCPYGEVFNEDKDCVELKDDSDKCGTFSNKERQCLQCKDNNKFLNRWPLDFPETCYTDCPATLYGDPLINQCRRCHPTCYECTGEFYNNCLSCTGVLYFNYKENTCIPNCQTAGLTRSLIRKNYCIAFEALAELINVSEEIPINVNTFDYIEAKVLQPSSPEYETYWLFDVEKTNEINKELGLFDDIKREDEHPFTGDRTKLNVTVNKNFFKTEHKYVFGLKIYAENKGLEVPIYVYWTLTMNSPPYGGRVTTMPSVGLYNTTTFVIRCIDYLDENTPTDKLEYNFYYVEKNTNMKIKLSSDFSTNNEVYSNFTVRFYQLEYSNITIHCVCKDKWGATSETETEIMIVNNKHSELYNLKQIVSTFYLSEDNLTDIQLLARAEVLVSLGLNPYNDRSPSSYYTTYEHSLTGEKVIKSEPLCVNGYCNDNGDCEVIDIALTCKCFPTHLGKQCFIDKNGYSDLADWYLKMFERIMGELTGNLANRALNDILFNSIYKLFFAAQNFFQNDTFFEMNMNNFRNYLKTEFNYITVNVDRINKILDLDVFYFNYFYNTETQTKLTKKVNEGYQFRNKTLTYEEVLQYKNYFEKFFLMIDEDTSFIIKNNIYGDRYDYSCPYFNYYILKINETFDDEEFFNSLKTVLVSYKPTISFMKCLKEKYNSFTYYLNYIEYLVNPMSFDNNFYPNVTSPYITIKIYDINGNEIHLEECSSNSIIKIQMPFYGYDWVNYINEQKWLFLPENYKLEDDPVFRDPILIREDGSVSDDSVEERIKMYYRYYNIVGLVYTPNQVNLYEYTSFLFKNISDAFFLLFETNHLSGFSSMLIPNPMKFIVDGRFFYVPRYMVLLFLDNHLYNPVFYLDAILFIAFVMICLIFRFKDISYFDNLEILDFLVKEVYKNNFGYDQIDPGINDANIYKLIHRINKNLQLNNNAKIRGMFDEYEFDDIKEEEDENKSENSKEIENNKDNIMGNKLMNIAKTNSNQKRKDLDDYDPDKKTEIKTNKKRRKTGRSYNSKSNKSNKSKDENKKSDMSNPPPKKERIQIMTTKDEENSNPEDNYPVNDNKKKSQLNINHKETISEEEVEDFDENKIEKKLSSEKSSQKPREVGFNQINSINSKMQLNSSKYSGFSKQSKQSKRSYFIDKDNTRPNNYVAIEKFHNKSYKLKIDNNFVNYDEEKKRALDEYTRLNNTTYEFFKYNLKTRHILISSFTNVSLYHNRWKKLVTLLTQFFTAQLCLSIILTSDENILLSNIPKMLIASLISMIISNILMHLIIPFFSISFFERKKLYRYAEHGESLYVFKVYTNLVRKMKLKNIFAYIIIGIFWIINFYITLGFTAVWKVQRTAFIVCFFITIAMDLIAGEILIEGICAIFFIGRKKYNLLRNIGELINRYRSYRTLYP